LEHHYAGDRIHIYRSFSNFSLLRMLMLLAASSPLSYAAHIEPWKRRFVLLSREKNAISLDWLFW